jgi:glutamyl-tRNA synthetase
MRIEDLDQARCRPEYVEAALEDLRLHGLDWEEGPDVGGPFAPYLQSQRRAYYLAAWEQLRDKGLIYACHCSRRDIQQSARAPHSEEEPIYPGACRPHLPVSPGGKDPKGITWRFRVPERRTMSFLDGRLGFQSAVAGESFGDFVVWRKDDVPAYQLAVVVDDAAMRITEVVRGEDLLVSTFRQLLLYEALELEPPAFFHCPLLRDKSGVRLAKRNAAMSLRELRKREEG